MSNPNQKFSDYAQVCEQIEQLEERKAKIKADLIAEYGEALTSDPKLGQTLFGKFTLYDRANWVFDEETQDEIDKLKAQISKIQKKSKAEGKAENIPTTVFKFDPKKDK